MNYKKKQKKKTAQSFITDTPNKSGYFLDLTRTLLWCNIPLIKLENFMFCKFLENVYKQTPDHSTLRKNDNSICYDETIQKIRSYVDNKGVWVFIDESL